MNQSAIDYIRRILQSHIPIQAIPNILGADDFISIGEIHSVFHPDVFKKSITDGLADVEISPENKVVLANDIVNEVSAGMEKLGYYVLNRWWFTFEASSCDGCPAYQWVVHREGIHLCRLHIDIKEEADNNGNWHATPLQECIRPLNVGACYLIAQKLNITNPMIGKIDAAQYEIYKKERDALCL